MYQSKPVRTLVKITSGFQVVNGSETEINKSSPETKSFDPSCNDCENIFGLVRSELAGSLRIYQGIYKDGGISWVALDTIAVSASAFPFVAGSGAKIAPIRLVGQVVKATFQLTSGGPSSNFELLLLMQ